MSNQPPLNPDAIFTAGEVIHENFGVIRKIDHLACTAIAERAVSAYLAVAQPEVLANSKPNQNLEFAQPEVNTVEELEALPDYSVVRDSTEEVMERRRRGWQTIGSMAEYNSASIQLPARILFVPEGDL